MTQLNADKIKRALAMLHLHQAGNGGSTVEAYKVAITGSSLSPEERQVLRNSVHLTAAEVGETDPR